MDFVVLDTDVASRYLRDMLPAEVKTALAPPQRGLLTFVTTGEMLRGARRAKWGVRRTRELVNWISDFPQVDSSADVSRAWAEIVAAREDAGRPINSNDAWIAACCIASDLPLATLNRKDFEGIEGLELALG